MMSDSGPGHLEIAHIELLITKPLGDGKRKTIEQGSVSYRQSNFAVRLLQELFAWDLKSICSTDKTLSFGELNGNKLNFGDQVLSEAKDYNVRDFFIWWINRGSSIRVREIQLFVCLWMRGSSSEYTDRSQTDLPRRRVYC